MGEKRGAEAQGGGGGGVGGYVKLLLLLTFLALGTNGQFSGVVPTSRPPNACAPNEATCANGQCISRDFICNGRRDCADGSDESGCRNDNMCEPNEYQCNNKKCVLKTWRCDGDDDCGDGSDEANCQPNPPGSPCRYYEWQCASKDQCIPKSFHCDGEKDCMDNSDEHGCSSPVIVVSPPPVVNVDQSFTFIINCTAVGVPTPEIVWRLNWGHVPEKCTMTNREDTGNSAFGELTCPQASIQDQGAYSCEAINSQGACFAGSSGCGQPGQDAILVVNTGPSPCQPGTFNPAATTARDCMSCWCGDIQGRRDNNCKGADLYLSHLPPPEGIFSLVEVARNSQGRWSANNRGGREQEGRQYLRSISQTGQKLQVPNVRTLGLSGTPYFSLPSSHTGNLLKSYGLNLKFSTSYSGSGSPSTAPLVLLVGKGDTVSYSPMLPLSPNTKNMVSVELASGLGWWSGARPATRDQMMRILSNVEMVLIRAQHVEGEGPVDVTVEDVELEVGVASGSGTAVTTVEQCNCPMGYTGLSCEECAPDYERIEGRCQQEAVRCPSGTYNSGQGCQVCPCPLTTPSNQFSTECYLDVDNQVTCRCPEGYTGRRCGECAQGYTGNPTMLGGSCVQGGQCSNQGSYSSIPDPRTGRCNCREGYFGPRCEEREMSSQCGAHQFLSTEPSVSGCVNCFCSGVATGASRTPCKSSRLYRDQIRSVFQDDTLDFTLTDSALSEPIPTDQLVINSTSRELSYNRFSELGEKLYYWALPVQFLGSKLSSYGGYLQFKLRYVPRPGQEESSDGEALVELLGNDIRLQHFSEAVEKDNTGFKYKVPLHEGSWERMDRRGEPANREHLLMALADLKHVIIKAAHSAKTVAASISDVSLDIGAERDVGRGQATAVEECVCPPGYQGLSCDICSPGYTRSGSGLYLGTCKPCECGGKSPSCDPVSGVCLGCRDFTTGEHCEQCLPGYQKNGYGECVPSSGSQQQSCDPRGSESIEGDYCRCKENVQGRQCNSCKPGNFHLSASNPSGCLSCYCSGVTDQCSDARLFWSTLRVNVRPNEGFRLTDKRQEQDKRNEVQYVPSDDGRSMQASHRHQSRDSTIYYWSLPHNFLGNKLSSYGGNMSIIQKYTTRGEGRVIPESDVIMIGNGLTLLYTLDEGDRVPNSEQRIVVPTFETGWVSLLGGISKPATREGFLRVLSNVEAILVRATVTRDMEEAFLRKVTMDIAVPYSTGGPMVQGAEECRCPIGYRGLSCEQCSPGYYRNSRDKSMGPLGRCAVCPCGGNEESCQESASSGEVECVCKDGWTGARCDRRGSGSQRPQIPEPRPSQPRPPPIQVIVSEPRIHIVELGQTVRFDCSARPGAEAQSYPLSIQWAKQSGVLPPGRSTDDGSGMLVITQVQSSDSGTYICTATAGRFVVSENKELRVEGPSGGRGGGGGGGGGVARPLEAWPRQMDIQEIGGRQGQAEFMCRGGVGQLRWTKAGSRGGVGRGAMDQGDGRLIFTEPSRDQVGDYVCSDAVGNEARVTVTDSRGGAQRPSQPQPRPEDGLVIRPEDAVVAQGDTITLTCQGRGPVRWAKEAGQLPQDRASQDGGVLTIRGARPEDSGMYSCTGTRQDDGTRVARVTVQGFRSPPSITVTPEQQTVGQGGEARITCEARGDPTPKVMWSKVGEEISTSPRVSIEGSTLVVRGAQVSDRGMYLCAAESEAGSARGSAIIEVEPREPPRLEIYPQKEQTISVGSSVLYQCMAVAGIPSPTVVWSRKDGSRMSSNIEVLSGGVLRMTSVTGEEAGQYLCVAENEAGVAEEEVTLNIQRPPTVSMEPRGVVQVRLGERMALRCSVTGDPTPTIVWTKIGAEGPREVARGAEDFVVRSMRRENEGTYACMASSPAGEVEERVQVYVSEDAGGFNQGGRPNAWDQGNQGGRPNAWDQGGRPNPYDQANQGRQPNPYDQGNQGGRRPNAWDQGARGDQGNPWNQGGQRSPQGIQGGGSQAGRRPPVIQSQGAKDFVVAVGNNMRLDANVTGNMASDITVEWVRQDGRTMSSRHQQRDSTLYIENANYEDAGVYVCRGKNSQGQTVFEFLANLVIATAPSIRLEPATQTVSPGDSPSIECQLIRGDQPVNIEWERQDGQPLSSKTVIARGRRLQFRNIAVSDQGRYVCRASNRAGTSQAVAEVIVDGMQGLDDLDFSSGLIFGPPSGGGGGGPSSMAGNGTEIQTFTSALGGSVTLPCRLTAGPDLVWSREGGELPVNHQVVRTSLTINGVEVEDSGRYICTSQGRTQYVDLNIERQQQPAVKASNGNPNKPDISVSESSSHPSGRPAVGHSFEARCEVDGIGNAGRSITWERMGGQMPDSFTVENNVLRSDSLTEDSAGVYRCKVETRKGMFFEMYTLEITGDM